MKKKPLKVFNKHKFKSEKLFYDNSTNSRALIG